MMAITATKSHAADVPDLCTGDRMTREDFHYIS